ncbi:MAG: aggregation factor core protein MAFp3, isoform E, partial [Rhodopirellula bahusiensis]
MNPFKSSRFARRHQLYLAIENLESRQLLAAGPYAPAAGEVGSTAIDRESPAIVGWASGVAEYNAGAEVDAAWQDASEALGPAEGQSGSIVSLGRSGTLTLTFDEPIRDGLGFDFAVFENSFSDMFLELGYVEVSSDGVNFVRFESDSLTDSSVGAFGSVDPTNLDNLAGKYRGGFGTPFDLQELRGSAGLDVTAITHVRLVDIVGDGTSLDGQGDPIYDPTPTVGSAGLDVDGVAVLHAKETGAAIIDFETLGSELGGASFSNQSP